ncbi:MAG TPA: ATP-binding cassette domain-containing protein [Oscillospiraceae bacterium]|nr:ATP-binding cassette domain-containing protein [Oscillospiraceae bacterium]
MISITGLSKIFGKGTINEKIALDNVYLSLAAGEFVTVIGGNGAGKSTLLNCIAGVYPVDAGQIVLNEVDITEMPEFKRSRWLGRVFQDPALGTAFDMTIEENLAIAYGKNKKRGLQPGITKKEMQYFSEQLVLLELGLEDRMKDKVGLLSGGQRQALTLLMAALVQPKLLLLDEHTAALDPVTAKKVLSLTKQIVKEHQLSTLMITHNMQEALDVGTRTIMMYNGQIMLDLQGEERAKMTVEKLVNQFEQRSGSYLTNDRMLLN